MEETLSEEVAREKKSFLRRHMILILGVVFCVILFLGFVLLAFYSPYREGVHLRVRIEKPPGLEINGTYYVSSDVVPLDVENYGTEIARGEDITIEITGDNVVRKMVNWTWGDVEPNQIKTVKVPFEVEKESEPFVLVARVYYRGELHDEAHLP